MTRRRVAVVTGGTRGIGLAITRRLAADGYVVVVCARRPAARLPKGARFVAADVRKRAALDRVARAARGLGAVTLWVNAAGVSRWQPVATMTPAFAEDVIGSNLFGTLWGSAAAAGALREGGAIVNVSSLAGKRGSAHNSAYCAAKFGVNGITQALAKELGPRGIRVNAVCPVYVATEHLLEALREPAAPPRGRPVAAYLRRFAREQTALGRLPRAEEVAAVVAFLAGEEASAVTGQCLNVDCGTLPQ